MEKFKEWFYLKEGKLLSSLILMLMYGWLTVSLIGLLFLFTIAPLYLNVWLIFRTLIVILVLALISVSVRKVGL